MANRKMPQKRMMVKKLGSGAYSISEGGKTAIVPREYDMRAVIYLGGPEKLFGKKPFVAEGGTIDLCNPIKFREYDVMVSPNSIDENYIFEGYLLHYAPKEGDVVLDCGAHLGLFALYISKAVGKSGKILCLEPDPENAAILRSNLERNSITNTIVVEKALWGSTCKLSFKAEGDMASGVEFDEKKHGKTITVDAISYSDLIAQYGLGRVDFVKMDIEGAELEAIGQSLDFIKSHPSKFAIASYHIRNGEKTCKKLEDMFRQIGFDAITEYPQHLTTYAMKK